MRGAGSSLRRAPVTAVSGMLPLPCRTAVRQLSAPSVDLPILAASRLTVRNEGRSSRLRLQHLTLAECPVLGGDHGQAPQAGPGCCGFALSPDRTRSLPQGVAKIVSC